MSTRFEDPEELERFEQRLRAGAAAFRREPSPGLHARILAAVRAAPRAPVEAERRGTALALAAAVLVLLGAWWLTRAARGPGRGERARQVVALSRGLFDAGTRVLTLPGEMEGELRLEAARLLSDTTRAAESVVRGLPAPLRARLEM
jgi:hypothetical protein